ncbi:hypothetical protein FHP25_22150 [Vineibacter terrae]|uniref:Uncharacterized protein n=1 Tax=Vineibacter terrae TaxID=2586908 RepID=A0A5C8PH24_9HYPH|nr:hypothetical protein [Vineibacter terrae]TXL73137.1 hypothetical protein FHP25_22150 [Vineibacter terrae]
MDADASSKTTQHDVKIIDARGVSPQVLAEEREAFAVEREALAVEREAGAVMPPEPPTMGELLVAAQAPVTLSERMMVDLPPDSPRRAFLDTIHQQARAIVRRILQEIEDQSTPAEPAAPAGGRARK